MYQSSLKISTAGTKILKKELIDFCISNKDIYSKAFCGKISLEKQPNALLNRNDSHKDRLSCFSAAMDILKNSKELPIPRISNKNEFEMKGYSRCGKEVFIHLRKEKDVFKNMRIFFVSCYFKK